MKIILQDFEENNNIINIIIDEKFMRLKNHVYYVLNTVEIFLSLLTMY